LGSSSGEQLGYRLDIRGIVVGFLPGERFCFSPKYPNWLWGPHSLLFSG